MQYFKKNYPLPRFFPMPFFVLEKKISFNAQIAYGLILNRALLSQKHGYFSKSGDVYVIYTIKELSGALNKSETIIKKTLNELEAAELIERRKFGKDKRANCIFPLVPDYCDTGKKSYNAGMSDCTESGNTVTTGNSIEHGNTVTTGDSIEHGNTVTTGDSIEHGNTVTTGDPIEHGNTVTTGDSIGHGNTVTTGDSIGHGNTVTTGDLQSDFESNRGTFKTCNQSKSDLDTGSFPPPNYTYKKTENIYTNMSVDSPADTQKKRVFGKYGNVLLSESDFSELNGTIPDFQSYLDYFSEKLHTNGYRYSNHKKAILQWWSEDGARHKASENLPHSYEKNGKKTSGYNQASSPGGKDLSFSPQTYDLKDMFLASLKSTYNFDDAKALESAEGFISSKK